MHNDINNPFKLNPRAVCIYEGYKAELRNDYDVLAA